MDNNKKIAYAEVTDEMIQGWKAKHGDAEGCIYNHEIKLGDDKDSPVIGFYLCVPSRTVVDRVAELGLQKQIASANKVLIANCVLAGDMDVLERDGNVYEDVLSEIQKLQKKRTSSVKKL